MSKTMKVIFGLPGLTGTCNKALPFARTKSSNEYDYCEKNDLHVTQVSIFSHASERG